jgi:hypothetical protein
MIKSEYHAIDCVEKFGVLCIKIAQNAEPYPYCLTMTLPGCGCRRRTGLNDKGKYNLYKQPRKGIVRLNGQKKERQETHFYTKDFLPHGKVPE